MHQFASGSPGPVAGLARSEPPLSPQTIGRAPSFLEAPTPLRSVSGSQQPEQPVEELLEGPVKSPAQIAELLPTRAPVAVEPRRVVVRLVGDEELELGTFRARDEAVERAKEVIAALSAAESAGEWPEFEGRYLRPGSIVSVDIQVAHG